jgi:hypothetical protein
MQREPLILLPEVKTILEALLVQAEQPERKQVVRVRLGTKNYDWYYAGSIRYSVNEQLQLLEAKGWLRLHWQKHEKGNLLEAIDLVKQQERVDELNTLLGRMPREAMRTRLRQLLDDQEGHGGWFNTFLSWAKGQLDSQKSPAPLNLMDPDECQDLLSALSTIATLQAPIFERTLSVKLFKDSKRLEELRGGILMVLRAHDPEADLYKDDEWGLLQAHHIKRPPERVPLTGPLHLLIATITPTENSVSETSLSLESGISSISLPEDVLRLATITSCPATALVTIENLTSFSELLLLRPPDMIAVHTGGFASPSLTTFLRSIRACRPDLPYFHWGDIDAGGLRILAHLRRQLGHILPLGMDEETVKKGAIYAQPLTPSDKESLRNLLTETAVADCTLLIHLLMKMNLKLEQEAISARDVVLQMRSLL